MRKPLLAILVAGTGCLGGHHAWATESASSIYVLGTKGPLAGVTPPEGVFLTNDFYIYRGDVSATTELQFGPDLTLGADLGLLVEVPTVLWMTGSAVLGGRLGLAMTLPYGGASLEATLLPGPFKISPDLNTFADPLVTALIGWQSGNFHMQAGVNVNVPVGGYRDGDALNLSRNYWAANFYAAVTWLDPAVGLDLSSSVGYILNGVNEATDYQSGNEFHWEWAAVQHFNEQFSAGFVGYYYQQLTGDSGSGAVLGEMKGMVAAAGGVVGYDFRVGALPVSTNVRYYHEFEAEKRLAGDSVFLSFALPLWVPGASAQGGK